MRKFMTSSLALVLCLAFMATAAYAAKFKPGTYEGTAQGYSHPNKPGKIDVKVTVDKDSIKNIQIVTFEQTNKGAQAKRNADAQKQIPAQIVAKQSLAVDSVAKASASSMGIELAVAQALEKATVQYKDGTYTGTAQGFSMRNHPGAIAAKVTIKGGKIANIEVTDFKQTDKGAQAKRNAQAKKDVPAKIVATQSTAVDSIAKASFSSDGIKLAVARALDQAR